MERAYVVARSWGHSWRDFMDLPIPMWRLELEAKQRESAEIDKRMKEAEGQMSGKSGGFDWEAARREHREKKRMRDGN